MSGIELVDSLAVRNRPKQFSDIVGNSLPVKTIKGHLARKNVPRTWLFSGEPGSGKCIVGDSLVLTPSGLVKIKELVGNKLGFIDKKVDLLTYKGIQTTSQVFKEKAKQTFKITTEYGFELEGTPEHSVLVLDNFNLSFKKLSNLNRNDIIAFNFIIPNKDFKPKKEYISKGYLFALLILYTENIDGKLVIVTDDKKIRDDIISLAKEIYGHEDLYKIYNGLEIPKELLCPISLEIWREFYSWLVNCSKGHITLNNETIIKQLQILILSMGSVSKRYKNSLDIQYYIYNNLQEKFNSDVCFSKLKNYTFSIETYEELIRINVPDFKINNYFFDKVVSIEEFSNKTVYDVTEPVTHSFIANGIINHNTTSARLLAMTVNCQNLDSQIEKGVIEPCLECTSCKLALQNKHPDIYEMNAGSEQGNVDSIRTLLSNMRLSPRFKTKCFIMDEAQAMSASAKQNLLKPLEEPPKHVLWALCTTDPEKLPRATFSRCVRLYYEYPLLIDCSKKLWKVCKSEFSDISDIIKPYIKNIASSTNGQMRDGYSVLETIAAIVYQDKNISKDELKKQFEKLLNDLGGDLTTEAIRFITFMICNKFSTPLDAINKLDASKITEFLNVLSRYSHYATMYFSFKCDKTLASLNRKKFYGVNFIRFEDALNKVFLKLENQGYSPTKIFYMLVTLSSSILEAINKNRLGILNPEQSLLCAISSYMEKILSNKLELGD